MRVVCIDADDRPDCPPCDLTEGEAYTVIDTMYFCKNKYGHIEQHTVYILAEKSKDHGYGIERFAPCSDLDETTLVNEEWEEKYCVPVNEKA